MGIFTDYTSDTVGNNINSSIVIIDSGASISNVIDLTGKTLLGIHMPALWTAANITFQVSEDGITYDNLYDRFGTEVTITVAQGRYVIVSPSDWLGIRFIKIRSGTSSVPVTQGASRNVVFVSKAV